MTEPAWKDILVVCAVMERDGKIFAAQRGPGMDQQGLWEFPGGKVEAGEDPRAALVRELKEELGICADAGAECGETRTQQSHRHRTIILRAYRTILLEGEPTLQEHALCGWFYPEELKQLSWCPADIGIVSALLS